MISLFRSLITSKNKPALPLSFSFRQLDCLEKEQRSCLTSFFQLQEAQAGTITLAVVLTHDCSISPELIDKEPDLEILLATVLETPLPQYRQRKNPRKLHIEINSTEGVKWAELQITKRSFLPKRLFQKVKKSENFFFSEENKQQIRRWLAARYQAPSYPDNFDARFKSGSKKTFGKLEKALKNDAFENALGLFIQLSPRDEEISDINIPYEISLLLILKKNTPEAERVKITALRNTLVTIMRDAKTDGICMIGDNASLNEAEASELIEIRSEDTISLYEYDQYDLLLLEHLSESPEASPSTARPVQK